MSDLVRDRLTRSLRWVEDPTWYDQFVLPPFRKYHARFTASDRDLLNKARKFVRTSPRCSVKAFCVPEWDRNRKRPIFWPDLNAAISKALLIAGLLPLKPDVRKKVNESAWSVQFDFASWYDQLPLNIKISSLFSFDGSLCLASLPMGFRPSADVAQCVSTAITDFPLPEGVNVTVYIDNIRFGGPSAEAVAAAAKTFLERADKVGAIVNDREIKPTQVESFLGEQYDLIQKTRCLTPKTVEKLKTTPQIIDSQMTARQLAAVFGILFFASEVLNTNLSCYFNAMRYYRTAMARLTNWDDLAPTIPLEARAELTAWLNALLSNCPVPTVPNTSEPELTIYCDASEYGWGAACISAKGTRLISGQWTPEDRASYDVSHSTVAEPLAVRRIVAALVPGHTRHARILSDHQGLVFAGNKGYGKCKSYNDMCAFLAKFSNTSFSFDFVPGVLNSVADSLSRGLPQS